MPDTRKNQAMDTFMQGVRKIPEDWLNTVNPAHLKEIAVQTAKALVPKGPPQPNIYMGDEYSEPDEGIGIAEYNRRHPVVPPAIAQYLKSTYGSWEGLGKEWREHPLGPISDAAMLAELGGSFLSGQEELDPAILAARSAALAAGKKVPLTAGKIIGDTGKTVGVATSPMAVPIAALHVAKIPLNKVPWPNTPAAREAIQARNGDLTPQAQAAVDQATNGRIPAIQVQAGTPNLTQDLRNKGANTPATREAIARAQGVTLSRSQARQTPIPPGGKAANDATSASGHAALASRVAKIAPPPNTSLGEAWTNAQNASQAGVTNAYEIARQTPGHISDPGVADDISRAIENRMGGGTPLHALISGGDGAAKNAALHVQSLMDDIRNGYYPVGAARISDTIGLINDGFYNASPTQRRYLYNIKAGLNDAVEQMHPDSFSGSVDDLNQNIFNANNAYSQHQQTFFGTHPSNGTIVNPVAHAAGNAARTGDARAVDQVLTEALIDPSTAATRPTTPYAYGAATDAGLGQTADEHIQHTVGSVVGDPTTSPQAAHSVVDDWGPHLDWHQTVHLPLVAETKGYLSTPAPPPPTVGNVLWPAARTALTTGATVAGSHLLGIPMHPLATAGQVATSFAGEGLLEKGIKPWFASLTEGTGAPRNTGFGTNFANRGLPYKAARGWGVLESSTTPPSEQPAQPEHPMNEAPTPLSLPHQSDMVPDDKAPEVVQGGPADEPEPLSIPADNAAPRATGGRIERASGGKVDNIEHLIGKLMASAKSAKKVTDKTTEPLLNMPDEHIVRALDVAQQAI